ncbi:MAG: murein biosynthesis integral membrane protein MurJ [Micromonosporaceae bacterium]
MSPAARRIAGAAALIAAITVLARVVGFARIVVFYGTVGENDLGQVYHAANTVPNIIFEIVAGGALASLVVPMLAGPLAGADRTAVNRTVSALLTWTLVILVPVAALVALLAEPMMSVLSGAADPEMVALGARMLRVFAPQLPLYGIGIVLTGVLQAHQRFAWPAAAPLLSSVTVIGAYLAFAAVAGLGADIGEFTLGQELVLSAGTTLGVAVLSLCLVVPVARLGVRYRPTLAFADRAGSQVRGLALAGAVTIAAQQCALLLVVYLTYPPAPSGSLVVYTFAQTIYFLPWGVLAVPLATSAYPALAEAAVTGDETRYHRLLSGSVRGILLLGFLGAAVLVAVARPMAEVIGGVAAGSASVASIASAIMWFAPGLVGYSLFALLTRALYARGDTGLAARATVGGWCAVIVADLVLVAVLPAAYRVSALAAGNSLGMVLLGVLLLTAVRRRAGPGAVAGTLRTGGAGLLAAVLAAAAGYAVARLFGATPHVGLAIIAGVLAAVVVLVGFAIVALLGDRRETVRIFRQLRGRRTDARDRKGSWRE